MRCVQYFLSQHTLARPNHTRCDGIPLDQDRQVVSHFLDIVSDSPVEMLQTWSYHIERWVSSCDIERLLVSLRSGGSITLLPSKNSESEAGGYLHGLEQAPSLRPFELGMRTGRGCWAEGVDKSVCIRVCLCET
jgi:hypothetical protein